ncbi:MAG TPA: polysaccharide deacetylase family protein [Solirubrobacterales bacterium]|nr:polysaccharide deacetylase family protein [Solirubrobacterales bacterium]
MLLNLGVRGLGVALLLGGLAIPAYAFYYATRPPVYDPADQVTVPLPQQHPDVDVPPYSDGVLVLCYHDLTDRPHNQYTVTPAAFAAQMAALRDAGFHTIDAAEFTRFYQGRPVALPSRPLLITFDDGAKGTWIYADRVLRRLGFEATVFLITADVSHHQPYYLNWAEVEEMQASGRWSFGSHTADGHGLVASDNSGGRGPFLTNRIWMPDENRLETLGEYESRVRGDLDDSIADIEAHGLPTPKVFAYPFSASVRPTNDPAIGPILARMLERRFSAQLDNTSSATLIRPHQQGPLPRIEVVRTTTAAGLLRGAAEAIRRSAAPSSEGGG